MPTFAADSPLAPPDNTAKNERDKSGETLTSGDQGNSPEDIKISQEIRKAVVKDDTLSATGKNIKIITIEGKVTLRGPVNSAEEKRKIEEIAGGVAGPAKTVNELEVKAKE